ncbi:hypothetical protein AB0C86_36785 [Streptomyces lavendulae]|uniref:hypothetical protein n=1 Tax=Streptomyces lavendulae TaxID=1914 RepID=UPI00340B3268
MAALQQSVEDAHARRESGSPAAVHDLRPAKKTAKKTMKRTAGTAKKVAAKRKPPRSA